MLLKAGVLIVAVNCMAVAGCSSVVQSTDPPAERPVFTGLVVKVTPSRMESAELTRETAADAARSISATAWTVQELASVDGAFRLTPPRTEAGADAMTPAQAWQKTYALRTDERFEYVEPAFILTGAPGETTGLEDCSPAGVIESGGDDPPIPGAEADSEWSLGPNGANVLEAWKSFGAAVPGNGVWVGHPDTGYRKHPEIWPGADSPIEPALGWDFVDQDDDPSDAFNEGFLRWPGHGTRTSSVIVSPKGRQLPGAPKRGISGVAPGARLIPMRVANGVVLFDQSNLASAIQAATSGNGGKVKQRVDVLSISLGGPPSRTLKDAVDSAERRGVLVIAAAGNNVRMVVWPARYSSVIAIAASNFDGRPWAGSSRGTRVAIGAPGESVWVASPKIRGGAPENCLAMSSGTSYGTATTAGIAALWVSFHRERPQFKALASQGQLTAAFRRILRDTSRPGKDWDTTKFGAGIVNAAAVLAAPLPAPTESVSAGSAPSRCDKDLEALESLLDESGEGRARIAQLFGTTQDNVCSIATFADEIAFLAATDASVSSAIEPLMMSPAPPAAGYSAARQALRGAGSAALGGALPAGN